MQRKIVEITVEKQRAGFSLRLWCAADIKAIKTIERLSFEDSIDGGELADGKWICQVLDRLGVGVIGFTVFESKPRCLKIIRLAVHPEFRRSGYGRAMLDKLKRLAIMTDNCAKITSDVPVANLEGAMFLKAEGFKGASLGTSQYRFVWYR